MTDIENAALDAANGAIGTATEHIKSQREMLKAMKIKLYCLTAVVCCLIVCATVLGCFAINAQQQTIREQQYALNMQYASMADLLHGAEITESTAETGDGGTAVAGNGNTVAGGDVNG